MSTFQSGPESTPTPAPRNVVKVYEAPDLRTNIGLEADHTLCASEEYSMEQVYELRAEQKRIAHGLYGTFFGHDLKDSIKGATEELRGYTPDPSFEQGDLASRARTLYATEELSLNEFVMYESFKGFFGEKEAVEHLVSHRERLTAKPIIDKEVYRILNSIRFIDLYCEYDGSLSNWALDWELPELLDPGSFNYACISDENGLSLIQSLIVDLSKEEQRAQIDGEGDDNEEGVHYASSAHALWSMCKGRVAFMGGFIKAINTKDAKRIEIQYEAPLLPNQTTERNTYTLMIAGQDLDMNMRAIGLLDPFEDKESGEDDRIDRDGGRRGC